MWARGILIQIVCNETYENIWSSLYLLNPFPPPLLLFSLSLPLPPSLRLLLQAYLYSHTRTGLFVEAVVSARRRYRGAEDQSYKRLLPCYPSTIWPAMKLSKEEILSVMNELLNLVGFNWNKKHTSSVFFNSSPEEGCYLLHYDLAFTFHIVHDLKGWFTQKLPKMSLFHEHRRHFFHAIAINEDFQAPK